MDKNYDEIAFLQELNHDLYHLVNGKVSDINLSIDAIRFKINCRADKLSKFEKIEIMEDGINEHE